MQLTDSLASLPGADASGNVNVHPTVGHEAMHERAVLSLTRAAALPFFFNLLPQGFVFLICRLYYEDPNVAAVQTMIDLAGITPQVEIDSSPEAPRADLECLG